MHETLFHEMYMMAKGFALLIGTKSNDTYDSIKFTHWLGSERIGSLSHLLLIPMHTSAAVNCPINVSTDVI